MKVRNHHLLENNNLLYVITSSRDLRNHIDTYCSIIAICEDIYVSM